MHYPKENQHFFQHIATWEGIRRYIDLTLEKHESWNDDRCINFLLNLSYTIVKNEDTAFIKTSYVELAKVFMETGLQYLNGGCNLKKYFLNLKEIES